MDELIQEGVHWVFDVYLKDPSRLIMDEASSTAANLEWDTIIQIPAKSYSEVNGKIPESYQNWYVVKIEHPLGYPKNSWY